MFRYARCLVLAAIIAPLLSGFKVLAEEQVYDFDVKRAPLSQALQAFALQSRISLSLPHLSYRDGKSRRLRGRYTAEEGLTRLLRGSSLTFRVLSSSSIRVFRRPTLKQQANVEAAAALVSPQPNLSEITEILVSVTRRTDILSQLPYPISVYSPESNEQYGALGTTEVVRRTPGIHTTTRRNAQDKIIVRGISDGVFNGRAQSLVNTYVDFSRVNYNTADPGLRLIDVERVEILRGPQSTLYGSGTLGGIYRMVSRKPNFEETELTASTSIATTKGGDPSYSLAIIGNTPIVDESVALRTAALYRKNGGYIDDQRLGLSNINSETYRGARGTLSIKPAEGWDIALTSTYQRFQSNDSNYYIGSLGPLVRDNFLREPSNDRLFQTGATINADLGWAKLVSATAWLQRDLERVSDASTVVPRIFDSEIVASPYSLARDIEAVTNETHLASSTGRRVEWIAGGFFSERKEDAEASLIVPGQGLQSGTGPIDAVYFEELEEKLTEIAFFGEATFFFNEAVSATGGLRWFRYKDDARSRFNDIDNSDTLVRRDENVEDGFIPKFLLSVQPQSNLTFYGQVSKGYRLGGIDLRGLRFPNGNVIIPGPGENTIFLGEQEGLQFFNSDFLTNYEAGAKYETPDGTLAVNAAAFFARWTDIQSLEYDVNGLPVLQNVGDADIYGFEVDAYYQISNRQELTANLTWNSSEIRRLAGEQTASLGDRLPGAPSFYANVTGLQKFNWFGADNTLKVDYSYVDGARLLFDRDSEPGAESYHQLDLKLTIIMEKLQISLFVNNLLDERANLFPFDNPFNLDVSNTSVRSDQVTPLRPRTLGFAIDWHF